MKKKGLFLTIRREKISCSRKQGKQLYTWLGIVLNVPANVGYLPRNQDTWTLEEMLNCSQNNATAHMLPDFLSDLIAET